MNIEHKNKNKLNGRLQMIYKYKCDKCKRVWYSEIKQFHCTCGNLLEIKEDLITGFMQNAIEVTEILSKTK